MNATADIVIYGAGSIGCYLGGRLQAHAGVRLIARPRLAAALREHGLVLSDLHGYHATVAPGSISLGDGPADAQARLVLVTVKSGDTAQVAQELASSLAPGTVVVSMQNGLENADVLRRALPHCTVLAGMVPFNVVQRGSGVFHQGSDGQLMVERDPAFAPFAAVFTAAGLPVDQRDDMAAVQRAKLLLNLNNAINALSDLPLRDELAQRGWRCCLALAMSEALDVFASAGLPLARLTPLPPTWIPAVLRLPDAIFARLATRMLAIDPLARSSMWEDLQHGRRTEIEALQGAVVRIASETGRRAPTNERLIELVRQCEATPTVWTSKRLLGELRSAT